MIGMLCLMRRPSIDLAPYIIMPDFPPLHPSLPDSQARIAPGTLSLISPPTSTITEAHRFIPISQTSHPSSHSSTPRPAYQPHRSDEPAPRSALPLAYRVLDHRDCLSGEDIVEGLLQTSTRPVCRVADDETVVVFESWADNPPSSVSSSSARICHLLLS